MFYRLYEIMFICRSLVAFSVLVAAAPAPFAVDVSITPASTYGVKSCQGYYSSPLAEFSCETNTTIRTSDLCCVETPNGVVMQTQFWDYNNAYVNGSGPANQTSVNQNKVGGMGPADNVFTIHGLWNDLCDGTYNQFCNDALEVDAADLEHIIVEQFSDGALYNKMKQIWVNTQNSNVQSGGLESLWEHEYNKHGTCMTTLQPRCYAGNYQQYQTAYDFYRKVVEVWDTLPTYQFLASADIYPSATDKYNLSDFQAALSEFHGAQVYVGCTGGDIISEIWYYHHVKGNVLTGELKPIDSLTPTTCKKSTVRYLPKH
jgi:ribonuclease T2